MEKVKKIPQRRCVGCGERFDKGELWRIVRSPEGEVSLDKTSRASGRGAYICKNIKCLKAARKARRLESNLETAIPDAVYEALEAAMNASEE